MSLIEWIEDGIDTAGELLSKGAQAAGAIAGGILAGPAGAVAGGSLAGEAVDFLTGGSSETRQQAGGLTMTGGASGGGGSGTSFPSMPGQGGGGVVIDMPSGGMQGPVYSAQDQNTLVSIVKALAASPALGQMLQRVWDFPRGEQVKQQHSDLAWQKLAEQLPNHMREGLEQFLLGFCAPIGLSKAAEDAFLLLTIAEAGYSPVALGLCSQK